MTIRAKLVSLILIMAVVMLGMNVYLRQQVAAGKKAVEKQMTELDALTGINALIRRFDTMTYWLTEMTISLSAESEARANKAKEKVKEGLVSTRHYAPQELEAAGAQLEKVVSIYYEALDAYFDEDRKLGQSLMAEARQESNAIQDILLAVQGRIEQGAQRAGEAVTQQSENALKVSLVLLVVALPFIFLLISLILKAVIRPVREMTAMMKRLAKDEFDIQIPSLERTDEIGDMAKALEIFRRNGLKALELSRQEKAEIAKKEKTRQHNEKLTQEFNQQISRIIDMLRQNAGNMKSLAQSMAELARSTSEQAGTVASASQQASSNVSTVATAAEELSASISEIAAQAEQSARASKDAVAVTQNTDAAVSELSESAKKIGDVVNVIRDIAEQTNLLALNATIEASRAGEAGKGFAVVANEVKALAAETAKATEDIAKQISAIQNTTDSAVEAIRQISDTIREVQKISSSIASAVEQQSAATEDIARNAHQAAEGNSMVSDNIVRMARNSEETQTASGKVLEAADDVLGQQDSLTTVISNFLKGIKAA